VDQVLDEFFEVTKKLYKIGRGDPVWHVAKVRKNSHMDIIWRLKNLTQWTESCPNLQEFYTPQYSTNPPEVRAVLQDEEFKVFSYMFFRMPLGSWDWKNLEVIDFDLYYFIRTFFMINRKLDRWIRFPGLIMDKEIEGVKKWVGIVGIAPAKDVILFPGMKVVASSGPFKGFEGRILSTVLSRQTAKVEFEIVNRIVPTELPFSQLSVVDLPSNLISS